MEFKERLREQVDIVRDDIDGNFSRSLSSRDISPSFPSGVLTLDEPKRHFPAACFGSQERLLRFFARFPAGTAVFFGLH